MNPARSIGPAIASSHYEGIWVYLVGPVTGTLLGAWSYNFIRTSEKHGHQLSLQWHSRTEWYRIIQKWWSFHRFTSMSLFYKICILYKRCAIKLKLFFLSVGYVISLVLREWIWNRWFIFVLYQCELWSEFCIIINYKLISPLILYFFFCFFFLFHGLSDFINTNRIIIIINKFIFYF